MICKDQSHKVRILLVEDDTSMGYLLQESLEMAGYQVDLFYLTTFTSCILSLQNHLASAYALSLVFNKLFNDHPL
jgi:CheY-like chemotaxis protein